MAVVLKAYCDGSGSVADAATPFVTLAGYAASTETWAVMEQRWPDVLRGKGSRPSCRYLHMAELMAYRDEYQGWSEEDKNSLLIDVYKCLYSLGWSLSLNLRGVVCTVSKADYAHACDVLPNLRALSIESICIDHVAMWAIQLIPNDSSTLAGKAGSVEMFFDQNEPFRGALMPRWNKKWSKQDDVLKSIAGMSEADMRTTPALQAAAYLAWLTNRYRTRANRTPNFRYLFVGPAAGAFYDYDQLVKTYAE